MKRVLRIKANIHYDTDKWTPEQIAEFLEKQGLYGVTVTNDMNLTECPPNWLPKQKTLNGFLEKP